MTALIAVALPTPSSVKSDAVTKGAMTVATDFSGLRKCVDKSVVPPAELMNFYT
jgi:hypothetical protein